jgi:hypothetical protein
MVRMTLGVAVVIAACTRREPAPATRPPTPGQVAVVHNDAAPALDPAVAARIPERGILFATTAEGIADHGMATVIYKLDRTGVHRVLADTDDAGDSLGWVDARSLFALGHAGKTLQLVHYSDGARVETRSLDVDLDADPVLIANRAGDVWLDWCAAKAASGDTRDCSRAYRQVWPRQGVTMRRRPPGIISGRMQQIGVDRGPAGWNAATIAAPPGYSIEIHKLDIEHVWKRDVVLGVTCRGPDGTVTYPRREDLTAYNIAARTTRWVAATPPMFEVVADVKLPVGELDRRVYYFRACAAQPLDGFAWYGDGIWAAYQAPPDGTIKNQDTGTWTIYVDDVAVGTAVGNDELSFPSP